MLLSEKQNLANVVRKLNDPQLQGLRSLTDHFLNAAELSRQQHLRAVTKHALISAGLSRIVLASELAKRNSDESLTGFIGKTIAVRATELFISKTPATTPEVDRRYQWENGMSRAQTTLVRRVEGVFTGLDLVDTYYPPVDGHPSEGNNRLEICLGIELSADTQWHGTYDGDVFGVSVPETAVYGNIQISD
jgi:hypothetical protein